MAHLQNWLGLLSPDIATIIPWSESLDKPLRRRRIFGHHRILLPGQMTLNYRIQ